METDEADVHFLMDVNLFGVFRVTRAFMPLIQKEKGRVVNIGSISGILARPLLGVYSMSKHSIESFTDTLADENTASGVSVSVIEPGNFKSDITASMLKHLTEETKDPKATPPSPEVLKRLGTGTRDEYPDPAPVAAVVERALFDAKPQRRYMIPGNQTEAEWTIKKQIQQLVQLNQNQPFSYSRDTLIAMLDAAIAEEKR
jgi:NAD(P)-dependent dehydrogenase (short-subunit alcohol dehydrogenase family)